MTHSLRFTVVLACALSVSAQAQSIPTTTDGAVFPIIEQDMQTRIIKDMQKIDWQGIQAQWAHKAKEWIASLPGTDLPEASVCTAHYFSPAIRLDHDIVFRGFLIYRRNAWVNPLWFVRPKTALLFFDGRSAQQKNLVQWVHAQLGNQVTVVTTAGNPMEYSQWLHAPVYYARSGMLSRFHIDHVPSLLRVGQGSDAEQLQVIQVPVSLYSDCLKKLISGLSSQ